MDLFLAEQMSEANTPDGRAALATRLRGSRFLGAAKGRNTPTVYFLLFLFLYSPPYQRPRSFHQRPPMPIQMMMLTALEMNPMRHQVLTET